MEIEIVKVKTQEYSTGIRADICKLQLCYNECLFIKAGELFKTKWNKQKETKQVSNYIYDNWIKNKNGWYEGFSIGDSSQSNAIESCHKVMKSFNLRVRAPTIKFMKGKGKEMVEEWSNERSNSLWFCLKLYFFDYQYYFI